ncbi:MAG: DUF362 domain-containing protein [Candidatus Methanofastidiosia archaeon]|jgi:uncharacterized protein (DUF362 family)
MVVKLSFLLDPPALFVLGVIMYGISKRYHVKRILTFAAGVCIVIAFVVVSVLLYLDVIRWWIPFFMNVKGSEWMFHSNYTGIYKEDVHYVWVIIMFALYPVWYYLGHICGYRIKKWLQLDTTVYNASHVKSSKNPKVDAFTVKRGSDPRVLLQESLSELGGIQNFVNPKDTVLIKPNICGGNPKRSGSFTSIEIIDELSQLIVEAGAHPVVVDADMIWTAFWPAAKREGYTAWAQKSGYDLVNLSETKLAYFDFGSHMGKHIISKDVLKADVIISVPTMKTHIITGITMGMKNMYGTLPQMNKAVFHKLGIETVIYLVNKAFPPNLTVIDGSIGGEAMGPLSSEPVNFQTVVAAGNVVAADAVACQLIGFNPMDIEHIKKAHTAGLGDATSVYEGELPPHEKDGCWVKPSVKAGKFYSETLETVLKYPYAEEFFDILADYVLYGMATHPLFENVTPEILFVLNDIFAALQRSGRIHSKKRIK